MSMQHEMQLEFTIGFHLLRKQVTVGFHLALAALMAPAGTVVIMVVAVPALVPLAMTQQRSPWLRLDVCWLRLHFTVGENRKQNKAEEEDKDYRADHSDDGNHAAKKGGSRLHRFCFGLDRVEYVDYSSTSLSQVGMRRQGLFLF